MRLHGQQPGSAARVARLRLRHPGSRNRAAEHRGVPPGHVRGGLALRRHVTEGGGAVAGGFG